LPVRIFVNDTLDASMKAGSASHPVGSSAVKEMYDGDGDLQGWAVMQKTQADSEGGKGWFWYEVTSTTDGSSPVGIGIDEYPESVDWLEDLFRATIC
jgi:hypothetical protein